MLKIHVLLMFDNKSTIEQKSTWMQGSHVPLFLSFGQVVNFLSYVFLTFAFPNNLVELLLYFLVTATFLLHLSLILATFMLL